MNATDDWAVPAVMVRPWCGTFRWPGKESFLVGTVVVRKDAPMHEVEAQLHKEFDAFWSRTLPDGTAKPTLVDYKPGAVTFVSEARWRDMERS